MNYLEAAFNAACRDDAVEPQEIYVCLMVSTPFYGGPEEGGWWGEDRTCVKYVRCASEHEAQILKDRIIGLAADLSKEAKRDYGQAMALSCDWLEARGLDADFLPEPDGPERFYVTTCDHVPVATYGERQYS